MILRPLCPRDAEAMLEWMHDDNIVSQLKGRFKEKTLSDCQAFIESSRNTHENLHLAIADAEDSYLGTVSLKNIHEDWAEFAIVVSKKAHGTGAAGAAMGQILDYGIRELKLPVIYWCVSKKNQRAIRFYNKNGYAPADRIPEDLKDLYREDLQELLWYCYQ